MVEDEDAARENQAAGSRENQGEAAAMQRVDTGEEVAAIWRDEQAEEEAPVPREADVEAGNQLLEAAAVAAMLLDDGENRGEKEGPPPPELHLGSNFSDTLVEELINLRTAQDCFCSACEQLYDAKDTFSLSCGHRVCFTCGVCHDRCPECNVEICIADEKKKSYHKTVAVEHGKKNGDYDWRIHTNAHGRTAKQRRNGFGRLRVCYKWAREYTPAMDQFFAHAPENVCSVCMDDECGVVLCTTLCCERRVCVECLDMVCRVYVEKAKKGKCVLPGRCALCGWMGEKEDGKLFPDAKKSRGVSELTTESPNTFRPDRKLSEAQLVYVAAFWLTMSTINPKLRGKMASKTVEWLNGKFFVRE